MEKQMENLKIRQEVLLDTGVMVPIIFIEEVVYKPSQNYLTIHAKGFMSDAHFEANKPVFDKTIYKTVEMLTAAAFLEEVKAQILSELSIAGK